MSSVMQEQIIPRHKFSEAFHKVGWILGKEKTGRYEVWTDPRDSEIWTIIPLEEGTLEYEFYQKKNIKVLLYALDLPEEEQYICDLKNQLIKYDYKLINRIINSDDNKNSNVPFELANSLIKKNVDAFSSFYKLFTKGKKTISIEDFKLNHTQYGSFVIPISIPALDVEEYTLLENIENETSIILKKYLDTIDRLINIRAFDPDVYAEKVIEQGIDSRLVKDFLGSSDSIAKYKTKYQETVKDIFITGANNPLLDFKLADNQQSFKEIELKDINTLPDEFITTLEMKEIASDSSNILLDNAKISVEVDSINIKGVAKFRVFAINGEELEKPFKAIARELPKSKQDFCADAFKSRDIITILGDINKAKHRTGQIIVDYFEKNPAVNASLFD